MNPNTKSMAVALMAIAMATAPTFNDKMAQNIAYKMNIDEFTTNEMVKELEMAKAVAESDMADDLEDYKYKDLQYLYDDLEEELFSCNNRNREMEIGKLLDQIESAMANRDSANGNFRA